jgi:hypothetical protein
MTAKLNWWQLSVAMLIGGMLLVAGGCSGCRPETPAEKAAREAAEKAKQEQREKEEKQRERPPFEIDRPIPRPSEVSSDAIAEPRVKPGHWMTETQAMKSNYDDWVGETELRIVDKQRGRPIGIDKTRFFVASTRPVRLAKGQPRLVENLFFVPPQTSNLVAESVLREPNNGSVRSRNSSGLATMKSYEYFFVVLAKEPARYTFLKTLNCVNSPFKGETIDDLSNDTLYYRVLLPNISRQVPLPETPLCWTTIAYVLWDEVDPDQLDSARRDALIDWLHWGGVLIVNGPDSLRLLQQSFLSPYLPATDGGPRNLIAEDLAPFNQHWSYGPRAKTLAPAAPWSGIKLALDQQAEFIEHTGELLAERRVGRGRVIVSAMQLGERDLLNWSPHFDNFFNACLLRRPPRKFAAAPYALGSKDVNCLWADPELANRRLDAALSTNLRYFARDVHDDANVTNVRQQEIPTADIDWATGQAIQEVVQVDPVIVGGIGAWNNFNATSNAARTALREAAGVQVPGSNFVITCLAVYLLVLVPLNWGFFRALGRVEYAWIAAPLIAIAGTAIVIKQAQLDIGFVRAQTEIALLELQAGHERGHLSRYTAFYTSLGTSYQLEYENPTALAAPFPTDDRDALLVGQSYQPVEISQNNSIKLQGLRVSSAATDMVHSEEMVVLGQGVAVEKAASGLDQLINRTGMPMRSVAVVHRDRDTNELTGMWLGELEVGEGRPFRLQRIEAAGKLFANERALEAKVGELNLEPMFGLALDRRHLEPGETRLVARIDRTLPGMVVTPQAPQQRGAALVVAHLDYGSLPTPRGDANTPLAVVDQVTSPLDPEGEP